MSRQREREFYAGTFLCRFSYLFSSSFFRPKRHFCDEDDGLVKTKKKKNCCSVFVVSRVTSSGVRTRAQKRRRGDERDSFLWDVIVKCDDICFQHILPRLNSNDVKFLYGVNSETRKLIKRSSRAKDLKEKFKVEEMSSISTLEFVWENKSLWPIGWRKDESWFCYRVAQTNKLELLKWAREEKKCTWDGWTIAAAAKQGNLEMVKYCVANECPVDEWTCASAASGGNLECLKYLREEVKAPWDS